MVNNSTLFKLSLLRLQLNLGSLKQPILKNQNIQQTTVQEIHSTFNFLESFKKEFGAKRVLKENVCLTVN